MAKAKCSCRAIFRASKKKNWWLLVLVRPSAPISSKYTSQIESFINPSTTDYFYEKSVFKLIFPPARKKKPVTLKNLKYLMQNVLYVDEQTIISSCLAIFFLFVLFNCSVLHRIRNANFECINHLARMEQSRIVWMTSNVRSRQIINYKTIGRIKNRNSQLTDRAFTAVFNCSLYAFHFN